MTRILLILAFIVTSASAKAGALDDNVRTFIDAVETRDPEIIAEHIRFPLLREYPIHPIENARQFTCHFRQIFDDEFIDQLVNSDANDWKRVGWRGVMFQQGKLWLDGDTSTVRSIPRQNAREHSLWVTIISEGKRLLHDSVSNHSRPLGQWQGESFRVRVDQLDDRSLRYVAWPVDRSVQDEPSLVLHDGEREVMGSGGNHFYEFSNDVYRYRIDVIVLGSQDSPDARLSVFKGEELLVDQPLTIEYPMDSICVSGS